MWNLTQLEWRLTSRQSEGLPGLRFSPFFTGEGPQHKVFA